MIRPRTLTLALMALLLSCSCKSYSLSHSTCRSETWGTTEQDTVNLITLTSPNGTVLKVSNYGASIIDIITPDRKGIMTSAVLGFDSFEDYLRRHPNFGSTIGRYAGRISNAQVEIDGTTYPLQANRGNNCVHGGKQGLAHKIFSVDRMYQQGDTAAVRFSYFSPDGECGFPGNLNVSITYMLTPEDEVMIQYAATTDKATVINLTNHVYFNLSGGMNSVLDDEVKLMSDSLLVLDSNGTADGDFMEVKDTPYDFREFSPINSHINSLGHDLDRTYQLKGTGLRKVAEVHNARTGRKLEAWTTEPAMQLFVSDRDLSEFTGHGGHKYDKYYGVCLEMQHYPDSPRCPNLPTTILRPGETYRQTTIYKISLTPTT